MKLLRALRAAFAAAFLSGGFAIAADPAPAAPKADPAKGQQIMSQVCAACHGTDGNSVAAANPKLAGQVPEYVTKQLHNFKPKADGKPADRPNPIMMGFASQLDDQQMRDIAAYLATQKLKPEAAKRDDTIELGRKIYRGGIPAKQVAACAGCHGATGAGMPSQYPALAGQYAEYIEAQLKAFRAGERANDPNRMMRASAAKLTDAEMKAVANYIAGLR
jgi:cytochrome c553